MKRVAILGSTGSVGRQTLEVIGAHRDKLSVCALSCHRNVGVLLEQAAKFGAETVICDSPIGACSVQTYEGQGAFERFAREGDYDILVVAVVGIAGLRPTLAALERGKTVCLANKETLVCGGDLVMRAVKRFGGRLLPIDSEHCAIHQCLKGNATKDIKRIILTASGGALRDMPLDRLPFATKREVLAHPNWDMGDKITVDCATMVNKGFEAIEAKYLFDVPEENIHILVHRQSVVHSMVQFTDNTYMAQLAAPDMRLPIQYALLYPERVSSLAVEVDFCATPLTFEQVDMARYPALSVVSEAAKAGSAMCVAVNAADEVAVGAFLDGHIALGRIHTILSRVASGFKGEVRDVQDVMRIDMEARRLAKEVIC